MVIREISETLRNYLDLKVTFDDFKLKILDKYTNYYSCELGNCNIKMKDSWDELKICFKVSRIELKNALEEYVKGKLSINELMKWACLLMEIENYEFDLDDELVDVFYFLNGHMPSVYGELNDGNIKSIIHKNRLLN